MSFFSLHTLSNNCNKRTTPQKFDGQKKVTTVLLFIVDSRKKGEKLSVTSSDVSKGDF